MTAGAEPPRDCGRCPRLVDHRATVSREHPDWWGGAVPSFGDPEAQLLVLGLAPGRMGAHRTGKPFAGDASGTVLFDTLHRFGFADSPVPEKAKLSGAMITNAVRCLPPENRPTAAEIASCNPFLSQRLAALPQLQVVLCLGRVAHEALLRSLGLARSAAPFAHGAFHLMDAWQLADSYHCSRYNMNTRRLTPTMFDAVFADVRDRLGTPPPALPNSSGLA